MKVLLDACVWGGAHDELAAAGHDVVWAGEWRVDPGDAEILDRAWREKRVLVTLDKDFGALAIVEGLPHAGIVRLVGISARKQGSMCLQILNEYGTELRKGAVITAETFRLRIRPPPQHP